MKQIFVASSFHNYDRDLVNQVHSLFYDLDIRPRIGRNMGGEALEREIERRIESCDGLVALFTKRQVADGWPTHPWVLGEFGHAVSVEMPAIAVVEDGIDWKTTKWGERDSIALDRNRSAETMLCLVRQISAWQRDAGITLKILLKNPEVLTQYMENPKGLAISYRYIQHARLGDFVPSETFFPEGDALVVVPKGIPDPESSLELKVEVGRKLWHASVRQFVQADLKAVEQT